jgi:hypothetical protein
MDNNQPKTGSVTSKSGRIKIGGEVVTGIKIQGEVSDETLQAALNTLHHLQTGGVSGAKGVEIKGDFISGLQFSHLDPEHPTLEGFLAELKLLRQQVAALAGEPDAPLEAQEAVKSLDDTITAAEQEKPLARRVVSRLQEAMGFITDAGKTLEAAGKAGPLLAQALGTAAVLYQVAQNLF